MTGHLYRYAVRGYSYLVSVTEPAGTLSTKFNTQTTRVLPWILPLNLTDGFSSKIFDPRYFTESVSHSCWTMPRAIYGASQFASQIGGADGAARHR